LAGSTSGVKGAQPDIIMKHTAITAQRPGHLLNIVISSHSCQITSVRGYSVEAIRASARPRLSTQSIPLAFLARFPERQIKAALTCLSVTYRGYRNFHASFDKISQF